MEVSYEDVLDHELGVVLLVDFENDGAEVVDYSLMLLLERAGETKTIRVYDSAHGFNEMHRYTRAGGKQKGTEVHRGTLGEGMRTAIQDIKKRYLAMIEGWEEWR